MWCWSCCILLCQKADLWLIDFLMSFPSLTLQIRNLPKQYIPTCYHCHYLYCPISLQWFLWLLDPSTSTTLHKSSLHTVLRVFTPKSAHSWEELRGRPCKLTNIDSLLEYHLQHPSVWLTRLCAWTLPFMGNTLSQVSSSYCQVATVVTFLLTSVYLTLWYSTI